MSETAPPSVVRLKIPCADGRDFLERFAARYVQAGIFVPVGRPRPVGSRLHLKLEFRDGTVGVSGDALVTGQGTPQKPGMTLRFTALHPGSLQFDLSPVRGPGSGPGRPALPVRSPATEAPARGGLTDELFGPDVVGDEPLGSPRPLEVRTSAVKLRLKETPRQPAVPADPSAGEPARSIPEAAPERDPATVPVEEPDRPVPGVPERGQVPAAAAEPTPAGPVPGPGTAPARAMRSRVAAAVVALGVAAAAGLAVAGAFASRRSEERLEAEIRLADARLREGRLVRPPGDSALDHLVAAKGLSAADARVAARLKTLADTFEQLGMRAAARGELREAAFHLEAAVRADPGRDGAARKLDEVRARLAREQPRAR